MLASCSSTSSDTTAGPASTAQATTSALRPAATTGTAPAATTPSSRWTADEQAVIDAYRAAMAAFDRALADPPSPDAPELAATTIDPALGEVRRLAAQWRGFGQALRYPPASVHRIDALAVSIDGATATIQTCNVDDGVIYEPATGKVLNDKVTTARNEATMSLVGGVWKLTTRIQQEKWEGVAGCAGTSRS